MAKKPLAKGIVKMHDGRYEARVRYQGKSSNSELHNMYVGMFSSLEEAKLARCEFILNLF